LTPFRRKKDGPVSQQVKRSLYRGGGVDTNKGTPHEKEKKSKGEKKKEAKTKKNYSGWGQTETFPSQNGGNWREPGWVFAKKGGKEGLSTGGKKLVRANERKDDLGNRNNQSTVFFPRVARG